METIFDFLARRSNFFIQWKSIFQRMLHPDQWRRIFQSKRKNIVFLFRASFPTNGNHYLNYRQREAYLKLLLLLLATIFFDFSDIPVNGSSFSFQQKRILKRIIHSCLCKFLPLLALFYRLVEMYFSNESFIVASGNYFFPFFRYFWFRAFFPSSVVLFLTNPSCWLVETILL